MRRRKITPPPTDFAEEYFPSAGGFERGNGRGGAGTGRHSVLGFSVPSAKRSGLAELPTSGAPQRSRSMHAHRGHPARYAPLKVIWSKFFLRIRLLYSHLYTTSGAMHQPANMRSLNIGLAWAYAIFVYVNEPGILIVSVLDGCSLFLRYLFSP